MKDYVYDQALLPPAMFVGELHQEFARMMTEPYPDATYYIVSPAALTLIQSGSLHALAVALQTDDGARAEPEFERGYAVDSSGPLVLVGKLNEVPLYVDPYRGDNAPNEIVTSQGVAARVYINVETMTFV